MLKWITPVALAALLGALAAPAEAQRYNRNNRYDRYGSSGTYRGGGAFIRMNDLRLQRRGFENQGRREELARRANDLAERVDRLYERGQLSDYHRNRAYEKLERIRGHVLDDPRLEDSQYRADLDWMASVEQTVRNWSRADRR